MIRYLPNVTQSTNGPGAGRHLHARAQRRRAAATGRRHDRRVSRRSPSISMSNRGSCPAVTSTSMPPTLSASRSSRARRARCSAAAHSSGVLRYITNKPKLNVTEGSVEAGYGITAHGDPNTNATAVLNLPLIADTLAIRGGDLQRPPGRLHQQRAEHVLSSGHRPGPRPTTTAAWCRPTACRSTTTASSATRSTR